MIRILLSLLLILPGVVIATELQVVVTTSDKRLQAKIENDLKIFSAASEPKLTKERIKNLYDLADEQITETLQANGYYNGTIDSNLKNNQNNLWIATFIVRPGPPTIINSTSLITTGAGKKDTRIQKYLVTPKIKVGSRIIHSDYEDTKEQILVDLNSEGYLRADFTTSTIEVDRSKNLANIKLVINTGDQYKFGEINFISDRYPDSLLRRYTPFNYGAPYSIDKLMQFQSNLEGSELFSKVRFDPIISDNPKDLYVPIDVRLTSKPRNRYTGSIGYGTDTNVRGSLSWLHRFSSPAGHKLKFNVSASAVRSLAGMNYIIPGDEAATDYYELGIVGKIQKFDDKYSKKAELFAKKNMRRNQLESIYGISFFNERSHLTSFLPDKNAVYLLPSVKWIWTDAHHAEMYDYGTKLSLSMRGGVKDIGSDNSVLETIITAKHIMPVDLKSRFILRGEAGAISSNNFSEMPVSMRFYTGGDNTVRGFKYNSLGPTDAGEVIGGRYLTILSAEYERNIFEKLNGVIFIDCGNSNNKFASRLGTGTGIGLRYNTPIGNLKLDVAKPLNIQKDWRLHLNFATDF